MRLLLVRHGPAGDREAWAAAGRDDALRPLTADGRRKVREAARGLGRLLDPPAALATSPLVRARDTAALLARELGLPPAAEMATLAPGRHPRALLRWLDARRQAELLAVVGHEPSLGTLAGWLVTGRAAAILELKKGGACLLDLGDRPRPGGARLAWVATPAMLRALGRGM